MVKRINLRIEYNIDTMRLNLEMAYLIPVLIRVSINNLEDTV